MQTDWTSLPPELWVPLSREFPEVISDSPLGGWTTKGLVFVKLDIPRIAHCQLVCSAWYTFLILLS